MRAACARHVILPLWLTATAPESSFHIGSLHRKKAPPAKALGTAGLGDYGRAPLA
jgi:hypothetical protein